MSKLTVRRRTHLVSTAMTRKITPTSSLKLQRLCSNDLINALYTYLYDGSCLKGSKHEHKWKTHHQNIPHPHVRHLDLKQLLLSPPPLKRGFVRLWIKFLRNPSLSNWWAKTGLGENKETTGNEQNTITSTPRFQITSLPRDMCMVPSPHRGKRWVPQARYQATGLRVSPSLFARKTLWAWKG